MISGCLSDDTRLKYWVEFSFGGDIVLGNTSDTSMKFPFGNDLQVMEVRITPVVPDLQLFGTPLSTNLKEGKLIC